MADAVKQITTTAAPSPNRWGDDPLFKPKRRLTSGGLIALVVKVVLLGIIDAVAILAVYILIGKGDWIAAAVLVAVVVLVNFIYLRRGLLPGKYLTPGLFFLAIFQIFVIVYTGYIAFTNAGDAHNSTKEDAIAQIIRTSQDRVPDSPSYTVQVFKQGDQFGMLVAEPGGDLSFGTNEQPLEDVNGPPDGWDELNLSQVIRFQDEVLALNVQVTGRHQ